MTHEKLITLSSAKGVKAVQQNPTGSQLKHSNSGGGEFLLEAWQLHDQTLKFLDGIKILGIKIGTRKFLREIKLQSELE